MRGLGPFCLAVLVAASLLPLAGADPNGPNTPTAVVWQPNVGDCITINWNPPSVHFGSSCADSGRANVSTLLNGTVLGGVPILNDPVALVPCVSIILVGTTPTFGNSCPTGNTFENLP